MVDQVKTRLADWLDKKCSLDDFRLWFVGVVKTAHTQDAELQTLVDSVGLAFACYAAGESSEEELRQHLQELLAVGNTVGLLNGKSEELKVFRDSSAPGMFSVELLCTVNPFRTTYGLPFFAAEDQGAFAVTSAAPQLSSGAFLPSSKESASYQLTLGSMLNHHLLSR